MHSSCTSESCSVQPPKSDVRLSAVEDVSPQAEGHDIGNAEVDAARHELFRALSFLRSVVTRKDLASATVAKKKLKEAALRYFREEDETYGELQTKQYMTALFKTPEWGWFNSARAAYRKTDEGRAELRKAHAKRAVKKRGKSPRGKQDQLVMSWLEQHEAFTMPELIAAVEANGVVVNNARTRRSLEVSLGKFLLAHECERRRRRDDDGRPVWVYFSTWTKLDRLVVQYAKRRETVTRGEFLRSKGYDPMSPDIRARALKIIGRRFAKLGFRPSKEHRGGRSVTGMTPERQRQLTRVWRKRK